MQLEIELLKPNISSPGITADMDSNLFAIKPKPVEIKHCICPTLLKPRLPRADCLIADVTDQ